MSAKQTIYLSKDTLMKTQFMLIGMTWKEPDPPQEDPGFYTVTLNAEAANILAQFRTPEETDEQAMQRMYDERHPQ